MVAVLVAVAVVAVESSTVASVVELLSMAEASVVESSTVAVLVAVAVVAVVSSTAEAHLTMVVASVAVLSVAEAVAAAAVVQ